MQKSRCYCLDGSQHRNYKLQLLDLVDHGTIPFPFLHINFSVEVTRLMKVINMIEGESWGQDATKLILSRTNGITVFLGVCII